MTSPTLKVIIPHGGGAVPYHWGRYRGVMQDMGRPPLEELVLRNVFFDTCVYYGAALRAAAGHRADRRTFCSPPR